MAWELAIMVTSAVGAVASAAAGLRADRAKARQQRDEESAANPSALLSLCG